MKSRTPLALLAVLTAVGTLAILPAQADDTILEECLGCSIDELRDTANKALLQDLPVSIWTDKTGYGHDEMITVAGKVSDVISGYPIVTITVVSPLNSIIRVDQLDLSDDGTFETMLNTAGKQWKYDGPYTLKAS